MFWQKAWLDTRWRFLAGLGVLTCMAGLVVLAHVRLTGAATADAGRAAPAFAGFLHDAWFRQGLPRLWCLFAILLGSGGLVTQAARGGAMFTLALPVTRARVVLSRAAVGLFDLYLLALLPSLSLALWAPLAGRSYASPDVFVASFSLFAGGAIFFAVPFFLSSLVEQFWVPVAAILATAAVITVLRELHPGLAVYTLAPLLTARDYFSGGSLPWGGLVASLATSASLIALAVRNIARRDF